MIVTKRKQLLKITLRGGLNPQNHPRGYAPLGITYLTSYLLTSLRDIDLFHSIPSIKLGLITYYLHRPFDLIVYVRGIIYYLVRIGLKRLPFLYASPARMYLRPPLYSFRSPCTAGKTTYFIQFSRNARYFPRLPLHFTFTPNSYLLFKLVITFVLEAGFIV